MRSTSSIAFHGHLVLGSIFSLLATASHLQVRFENWVAEMYLLASLGCCARSRSVNYALAKLLKLLKARDVNASDCEVIWQLLKVCAEVDVQ